MPRMKGNRRRVRKNSGSYIVIIPAALAAAAELKDGTVVKWEQTRDGLLLIPVGREEPKEE